MSCPNCGFEYPPNARFCGMCGTRLLRLCLSCGYANPLDYRFCSMCGLPLQDAAHPETLPTAIPTNQETGASPSTLLEGERRVVTVILADVKDSTDLMEMIGSERWVEVMNNVLRIIEGEIYRFGGEVSQFRGDGLVAFFGASTAHEDDPERAVLAAMAIQKAIRPFAQEIENRTGGRLQLRVGVNTGEVIVTSVGDERQYREDTAMGEAITVAARMETAAEAGTVLVSESTHHLLHTRFTWNALGSIKVKGISEPIAVYQPIDALHDADHAGPAAITPILTAKLTGREEEYRQLRAAVDDLLKGRGRIITITGDKGVGKSFLVTQVRAELSAAGILMVESQCLEGPVDPGQRGACILWLRGGCRSYNQSFPYSMWLDMLNRWLGAIQDEPSERTLTRLRARCLELWGGAYEQYYPFLASLMALPLEENFAERTSRLDAPGFQQQIFAAVRSWIEALARGGSLVLSFTDMHWADAASLELLRFCLPLCESLPLVWLAIFRSERTSPVWAFSLYVQTEYPHRLTSVALRSLSEAESAGLIDQLVGPEALSEETRALVIEKSEGNPYYIQEIIHSLVDQQVLAQDSATGAWHEARAVCSLDLPGSLQGLLLARIDRLSPEQRRVLQMASVIGPVFWHNVLEGLSNGGGNHLTENLTALQREQLIEERSMVPDLGMEYVFNSSLVRDVAYDSLLSAQRVAYHLTVAETLEQSLGMDERKQHEALIAYHYRRAGRREKELFYSMRAGEQARELYANVEAITHFTRALEILDELEHETNDANRLYAIRAQRFEALSGRFHAYYLTGDFETGFADSRALLPLAEQLSEDPVFLVDALLANPTVDVIEDQDNINAGLEMAERALAIARQVGDRQREMNALFSLSALYMTVRDSRWHDVADLALEIARDMNDKRAEVSLLLAIGEGYGMDEAETGARYLQAALNLSQKEDDKTTQMRLLFSISPQYERAGDYYHQLVDIEEKRLKLAREVGNRMVEGHAVMFCGQIMGIYLGAYEEGMAQEQKAYELWEKTNSRLYPLLRIAQMQTLLGRYDEALETLERAQPIGEHHVDMLGRAGFALVTAILYNALGDEAHLRRALDVTELIRGMVAEDRVSRQYAMVAACEATAARLCLGGFISTSQGAASDPDERAEHLRLALESSAQALEIYESFGFTQVVECVAEEIFLRHSLALEANGQSEAAADYLRKAYEETQRKLAFFPPESPYARTFMELKLHREISARYEAVRAG